MRNYFEHEVRMSLWELSGWQYDKLLYARVFELLCPGSHYAEFIKHPGEEIVVMGSRTGVPSGRDEDWLSLQKGVRETFYISNKGIRSVLGDDYNLVISRLIGVCMTWEEILELEVGGVVDFNSLDWRVATSNEVHSIAEEVLREIDKGNSNE